MVSLLRASLAPGVDAWGYSLNLLMAAIVLGGGAILGTHTHTHADTDSHIHVNAHARLRIYTLIPSLYPFLTTN